MAREAYERIMERRSIRRLEAWGCLERTRAFQEYERQHREEMEQNLPGAVHNSYDNDVDYHLKKGFLLTPEGEIIANHFGLYPLAKPSVRVIPYKKAKIGTRDNPFALDFHLGHIFLREGRYLMVELDLKKPNKALLSMVKWEIDRFRKHMTITPSASARGAQVLRTEDMKKMFQAYDLVEEYLAQGESENQSVLQATLKLYTKKRRPRLKNPPATDWRYQQVNRWHQKVKERIGSL